MSYKDKAQEVKKMINEIKKFEAQAPKLEVKYSVSKDGKWLITRTIITDIKSTKYMEKVLEKVEPQKV